MRNRIIPHSALESLQRQAKSMPVIKSQIPHQAAMSAIPLKSSSKEVRSAADSGMNCDQNRTPASVTIVADRIMMAFRVTDKATFAREKCTRKLVRLVRFFD